MEKSLCLRSMPAIPQYTILNSPPSANTSFCGLSICCRASDPAYPDYYAVPHGKPENLLRDGTQSASSHRNGCLRRPSPKPFRRKSYPPLSECCPEAKPWWVTSNATCPSPRYHNRVHANQYYPCCHTCRKTYNRTASDGDIPHWHHIVSNCRGSNHTSTHGKPSTDNPHG